MILLSIIIPAYNEERRLPPYLHHLIPFMSLHLQNSFEIIVVNDGSTDNTAAVTTKILGDRGRVIDLTTNQGKGGAIKAGVDAAIGKFICITDADGSAGVHSIVDALAILVPSHCHGLVGTRYLTDQMEFTKLSLKRRIAGLIFASLTRHLLGLKYSDPQCGFKMFRSDVLRNLLNICRFNRFGLDFELLYIAKKNNVAFIELPIRWSEVSGSKVKILVDGFKMLTEIFKLRLREQNLLVANIDTLGSEDSRILHTTSIADEETKLSKDHQDKHQYSRTP